MNRTTTPTGTTTTTNPSPDTENPHGPGPRLMTANTLEGDDVLNRQGDTLGEVKEIMIDVPRGRVAYAVMASGGFLGLGERFFAVPWSALTLDPDRECFVMDADKERFEHAPGFDKDHWPSSAEFDTLQGQIDTYWSAPRAGAGAGSTPPLP
jgi:sporulation protein YlmC with PRC-barrel domain